MRRALLSDGWQSSRYNFNDYDWRELQSLWIEDLGITFGAAVSSLKKSWHAYKVGMGQGDQAKCRHYAATINRIQAALGIEETSFDL
jgi:hypothetical protein